MTVGLALSFLHQWPARFPWNQASLPFSIHFRCEHFVGLGSLSEPGSHWFSWACWPISFTNLPVSVSLSWDYRCLLLCLAFMCVMKNWIQISFLCGMFLLAMPSPYIFKLICSCIIIMMLSVSVLGEDLKRGCTPTSLHGPDLGPLDKGCSWVAWSSCGIPESMSRSCLWLHCLLFLPFSPTGLPSSALIGE